MSEGYKTWIFDCDGVLLDSNRAKQDAFYEAVKDYGEEAASQLRVQSGVPRRQQFSAWFRDVLKRRPKPGELQAVVDRCGELIDEAYRNVKPVPGIREFLGRLQGTKLVVSGIEQAELERILADHGLLSHFDAIYGGNKTRSLQKAKRDGKLTEPAVYFGDTLQDHEAAKVAGLDFILVDGYAADEGVREQLPDVRAMPDFSEESLTEQAAADLIANREPILPYTAHSQPQRRRQRQRVRIAPASRERTQYHTVKMQANKDFNIPRYGRVRAGETFWAVTGRARSLERRRKARRIG